MAAGEGTSVVGMEELVVILAGPEEEGKEEGRALESMDDDSIAFFLQEAEEERREGKEQKGMKEEKQKGKGKEGKGKEGSEEALLQSLASFLRPTAKTPKVALAQVLRLGFNSTSLESVVHVGSIDISSGIGKEVIVRFDTSIQNQGVFFTDSNGLDMLRREVNRRPSWNLTVTEEVAGNYYPLNSALYLQDESCRLTVLVDRAEGGGSVSEGSFEVMLNRRLVVDDHRGVGEALDEQDHSGRGLPVRITQRILLSPLGPGAYRLNAGEVQSGSAMDSSSSASEQQRWEEQALAQPLLPFFAALEQTDFKLGREVYRPLRADLPPSVQVLSLIPLDGSSFLLRLQHLFPEHESVSLGRPVDIDIASLFASPAVPVASVEELSLTANQRVEAMLARKLQWLKDRPAPGDDKAAPLHKLRGTVVRMFPAQIRTFKVTIGRPRTASFRGRA
eukprot:GILI01021452.1.p1 GENE.GILI01021452.1~~GILI01021452.1.p1  ORF type:complete len:473 (-),score=157.22 GILI01021452.1:180-1523(-)